MEEIYVKLPLVEMDDYGQLSLKRKYPHIGCCFVKTPDEMISAVQVQNWPADNEEEPEETRVQAFSVTLGQPEYVHADNMITKEEYDAACKRHSEVVDKYMRTIEEMEARHKAELDRLNEVVLAARTFKEQHDKTIQDAVDAAKAQVAMEYDMKKMELEQEYEMKKLQLELETPKRFAQGEWVSGKTLAEVVKTLAGENRRKEE